MARIFALDQKEELLLNRLGRKTLPAGTVEKVAKGKSSPSALDVFVPGGAGYSGWVQIKLSGKRYKIHRTQFAGVATEKFLLGRDDGVGAGL